MTCDRSPSARRAERLVASAALGEQLAIDDLIALARPTVEAYVGARVAAADTSALVEDVLDDLQAVLPGLAMRRAPYPGWLYGLAGERITGRDPRDRDLGVRHPQAPHGDVWEQLTERERAVLARLGAGQTLGEIARALYLSEGTVASHVRRAVRKAGRRAEPPRGRPLGGSAGEAMAAGDSGSLDIEAAVSALTSDVAATVDTEALLGRVRELVPVHPSESGRDRAAEIAFDPGR
jgi:DNA-binding NarL/FixJ family response regulator